MAQAQASAEKSLTRLVHRIFLGLAILACLILLILWRTDNPRLERVRMSLIDTVTPSMEWVGEPLQVFWNVARDYEEFVNVYEQNKALRREIQSLRAWRETARALEEENAQLRALNRVQVPERTTYVTGDVFADSGGPFLQAALVNVGRNDGIDDGAAAVDGSGLVGRVVAVGDRASRLLLLTDFSSRVSVIIQPGARRAVLQGDGTRAPKLIFLDGNEPVHAGDLIETSGDGGVFPPEVPVGNVLLAAGGVLRANLLADYSRLEFVRLLRYRPDNKIDTPAGLVGSGVGGAAATDGLAGAAEGQ